MFIARWMIIIFIQSWLLILLIQDEMKDNQKQQAEILNLITTIRTSIEEIRKLFQQPIGETDINKKREQQ